jgi:two-component system, OmpR family, alkaline phosphatase synthesis response regulator PhoP
MDSLRSRPTIFVIDDHRDGAESMGMMLRLHRADVSVFYHGGDALNAARVEPPDLVLTDLIMPGLDGIETCDRLRQLPGVDQTFVFAITGSDHERRDALSAGCFDAVFAKPVEPAELLEAMAVFLKFRRNEDRGKLYAGERRFESWMFGS